jgi:hypothetical protein
MNAMSIRELIEKLEDIAEIHGDGIAVRVAAIDYKWTYALAEKVAINTKYLTAKYVDITGQELRMK